MAPRRRKARAEDGLTVLADSRVPRGVLPLPPETDGRQAQQGQQQARDQEDGEQREEARCEVRTVSRGVVKGLVQWHMHPHSIRGMENVERLGRVDLGGGGGSGAAGRKRQRQSADREGCGSRVVASVPPPVVPERTVHGGGEEAVVVARAREALAQWEQEQRETTVRAVDLGVVLFAAEEFVREMFADDPQWVIAQTGRGKRVARVVDREMEDRAMPRLTALVQTVRSRCLPGTRLVFLVEGPLQSLRKSSSSSSSSSSTSSTEPRVRSVTEDTMTRFACALLVQMDVQMVRTDNAAMTAQYVQDFTRVLCKAPEEPPQSALSCVKRPKTVVIADTSGLSEDEKRDVDIQKTWMHMLQQIPSISATLALRVVEHYKYPLALYEALNDAHSEDDARQLVVDLISRTGRQERSNADRIFRVLTTVRDDESALLNAVPAARSSSSASSSSATVGKTEISAASASSSRSKSKQNSTKRPRAPKTTAPTPSAASAAATAVS